MHDADGALVASRGVAAVTEARALVRGALAAGFAGEIEVQITGTHLLPDGLVLGIEDSGTDACAVTWRSAQGQYAALLGAVPLTDWRDEGDGLWSCPFPEGRTPGEVFESGRPMAAASLPGTGYFRIVAPVSGRDRDAFHYAAEDLDLAPAEFAHAAVYVWAGYDWWTLTTPIARVDAEARKLHLEGQTSYDMREGNRYRIVNVRAGLTRPRTYYLDHGAERVYVHPGGGAYDGKEEGRFMLSVAANVLRVAGSAETPARGIRFEDLDLSMAAGDAVALREVSDITLRGCRIMNAGGCGVGVRGHAEGVRIENNAIHDLGEHGVLLQGLGPGQPDVNKRHRVVNNWIHRGGRLFGHGSGVYISQSGHNAIEHNEIHDMPRYGTSIKGMRYQVLREHVEGVTWENRHDFLHGRANRIAYNRIHRVNLDSQDTGAMESWGPGRDNVYHHNVIHDVGNDEFDLQMGMYLDDATDHFTVTHNLIYNVRGTGKHITGIYTKGIHNRFENNIIVVTAPMDAALLSFFMADERADHHEYRRNIFYIEPEDAVVQYFVNWDDARVTASDHNLFWHAGGGAIRFGGASPAPDLEAWRALLDGRFDANSVVADPLFVNAAEGDFRLAGDSPAHALGIEAIDPDLAGLREDFPARLRAAR